MSEAQEQSSDGSVRDTGPGQILLVDDDECFIRLLAHRLASLRYRVTAETDPKIALARFQNSPAVFDVLLTDLSMPGLSGFELAQQVLKIRPTLPVIGMSGTIASEDSELARSMGWRALISKDVILDELPRELKRLSAR